MGDTHALTYVILRETRMLQRMCNVGDTYALTYVIWETHL